MKLEGSCHCRRVRFSVESNEPQPFMRCYCSICRKTAGSGGYAINLGADFASLKVVGKRYIKVYRARMYDEQDVKGTKGIKATKDTPVSSGQRSFCGHCGSALWLWDPTWPDLVHPQAGAIDTPLPAPRAHVHIMLGSKPDWVPVEGRPGDQRFDGYPDFSLAQWHQQHGG